MTKRKLMQFLFDKGLLSANRSELDRSTFTFDLNNRNPYSSLDLKRICETLGCKGEITVAQGRYDMTLIFPKWWTE